MRGWFAWAALAALAASQAWARDCGELYPKRDARKMSYGTRIGTDATIVGTSGLGTERAVIRVKRTRADVRVFCLEYAHDPSAKCIADALRYPELKDRVIGNCKTGEFIDLFGNKFIFIGLNKPSSSYAYDGNDPLTYKHGSDAKYLIFSEGMGEFLGQSATGGYFWDLEAFMALCPNRGIVEDRDG